MRDAEDPERLFRFLVPAGDVLLGDERRAGAVQQKIALCKRLLDSFFPFHKLQLGKPLREQLLNAIRNAAGPEADLDVRGPVALRYLGEVIGRGATTPGGVASEIPKARAADLKRVLAAR